MRLSTKSRYGTRALLELAVNYEKNVLPVNAIAKNQDISERYLQNILLMLVDAGLVKSVRGKKGGFELAKHPSQITLAQVLKTLEEDGNYFVECADDPQYCAKENCIMRDVWKEAAEAFYKYMDTINLEDILRMRSEKKLGQKILDYSI